MRSRIAICVLLLFAPTVWAQDGIKVGYMDIQRAINESQAGKKAKERLQADFTKTESDLRKEEESLKRLKDEMDKKGILLKDEERKSLEREFQKRYLGYQRNARDSQEEMRLRQNEATKEILNDLEKIVAEVGKSEKFTLILERSQLLYSDQGIDITSKVLEIYNARAAGKPVKTK